MSDLEFLIEKLRTEPDTVERNRLAMHVAESDDPRVMEALVELISRPDLADQRATLVHCMGNFDCAAQFLMLVNLVIEGNWEVAHEAFDILNSITSLSDEQVSSGFNALSSAKQKESIEDWRTILVNDLLSMFE